MDFMYFFIISIFKYFFILRFELKKETNTT